jgi:hydroxyethylthiazole kinase-like sugar kinase family protein
MWPILVSVFSASLIAMYSVAHLRGLESPEDIRAKRYAQEVQQARNQALLYVTTATQPIRSGTLVASNSSAATAFYSVAGTSAVITYPIGTSTQLITDELLKQTASTLTLCRKTGNRITQALQNQTVHMPCPNNAAQVPNWLSGLFIYDRVK